MKECRICGNEAYKDLDYCSICAETLCIISVGMSLDQDERETIELSEEESVHRLKLLIEKGWHHD